MRENIIFLKVEYVWSYLPNRINSKNSEINTPLRWNWLPRLGQVERFSLMFCLFIHNFCRQSCPSTICSFMPTFDQAKDESLIPFWRMDWKKLCLLNGNYFNPKITMKIVIKNDMWALQIQLCRSTVTFYQPVVC